MQIARQDFGLTAKLFSGGPSKPLMGRRANQGGNTLTWQLQQHGGLHSHPFP